MAEISRNYNNFGAFQLNLSFDGGGQNLSIPILFVKTIEKVIRLCTVLIFFLSGGCEDRDISWAFFTNLSLESIYLPTEVRENCPYFQNYHLIFYN